HWMRLEQFNLITAGLAVTLVFSVHSMVVLDSSKGLVPGWHETIFPPFFVAGALFSGFAMVLVLGIPLRKWFGFEAYLTERHIGNMAKMMLAAGLFVDYSYFSEIFTAFYSMGKYDVAMTMHRVVGPYAGMFWPTFWDIAFLIGSIGLFFFMFLLFTRLLPMLSMFELRKLLAARRGGEAQR